MNSLRTASSSLSVLVEVRTRRTVYSHHVSRECAVRRRSGPVRTIRAASNDLLYVPLRTALCREVRSVHIVWTGANPFVFNL
jgi:hypothetical protein